jgi:hypothetical protein
MMLPPSIVARADAADAAAAAANSTQTPSDGSGLTKATNAKKRVLRDSAVSDEDKAALVVFSGDGHIELAGKFIGCEECDGS